MAPRAVKVVFLDCDGVISPFSRDNGLFAKDKMFLLRKIIEQSEAASHGVPVEIVLSTSWRTTDFGRKEVAKHLALHGMRTFIGCTPQDNSAPRSVEILRWISENHADYTVVNFVALDDINLPALAPNKAFFARHAIVTNGMTGLTDEDAFRAIDMLKDENNVAAAGK